MTSLKWFPKRTGPGDIDAVGTRKMLGATELDVAELLVREMAQNSWDARIRPSERAPSFGVLVHSLDEAASAVLRGDVLTETPDWLELVPVENEVPVIEVFDRGTVGLSGPVRNDLHVARGAERNFIDYVLNVGAPRDMDMGGGTYGYGKTAAYVASRRGVVVIWSRTRHGGELEHRLIASAIGSHGFVLDDFQHTGRHWWGTKVDGRVEPLVGVEAELLASKLFKRGFSASETGTSVLVVDPQCAFDAEASVVEPHPERSPWTAHNLTTGIIKNLWPKLIRPQPIARSMTIELAVEGDPHDLEPVDSLWQAYADCLRAVRSKQVGVRVDLPLGQVYEISSKSPRLLLGHLALTKRLRTVDTEPARHVCLMRHQAELVVKYLEGPLLEDTQFDWVGVFKPVADLDDEFAKSEPPAHDDWIPPKGRSFVRTALRRIDELTREFVRPTPIATDPADSRPVAQLADGLADLVGSRDGGRVAPEPARRSGQRRGPAKSSDAVVTEIASRSELSSSGSHRVLIRTRIQAPKPVTITPSIGILTDGGADRDGLPVIVHGWNIEEMFKPGAKLVVDNDTEAEFVLEAPADVALDVRFTARESH